MRLIHTSDWQIGKVFHFVDDATQNVLQEARVEGIARLGALAREHGATAVLVAGDVYDMEGVSTRTLDQPIERMRQYADIEWHLIAGNHDPAKPNGVWDRLFRKSLPLNIRLHLKPEPTAIGDGSAWLMPAPLPRMHVLSDLTEWMDNAATPEGTIRIGLAHGSIAQFGSDPSTTHNYISPTRPDTAGLTYLAMGDWHGMKQISDRLWYSGTHETDAFDVQDGGHALLVDVAGPSAVPTVTPLGSGRFRWTSTEATISSADDVRLLEERLRAIDEDPSRALINLTVSGTLDLSDRQFFENRIIEAVGAAVRWLRADLDRLVAKPTADDLDAIDRGGFVRAAADRLKAKAENPADPESAIAALALQRLYIEHLKLHNA